MGEFQITLSLPSFGSTWIFGWDELHRLLPSSTRQFSSPDTLDAELLSGIREHVFGRSCERVSGSGGSDDDNAGSVAGAVAVFLYLLAAMCDTATVLQPRAR